MSEIQSKFLPWRTHSEGSIGFWHVLQDSHGIEIGSGDGGYEEEDARRIVACVNACEGIPTSELELAARDGKFLHAYDTIRKQRDELLAALKCARATLDRANNSCEVITDTIWHTPYETLFDFMDAAIEKAEKQLAQNAD